MQTNRATLAGMIRVAVLSMTVTASIATAAPLDGGNDGTGSGTRALGGQTERIHVYGQGQRCVRVASAGVRTRNAVVPGLFGASGTITLPPGPASGNIVWAGLYWVILGDTAPVNAVTLNGAPVTPVALPVTGSPCWPELSAFPYFANVTGLVVGGANIVKGLDDSGASGVAPESEGASLVVIYQDDHSSACEIIVLDGNDLANAPSQLIDNVLPVTCPVGMPALLTFIGGDGQPFLDDQMWNGVALGDGDDFDASDPPAPGAAEGWDTDTYGVPAAPPFTASLLAGSDCINWVATVLEVGVVNCEATPTESRTWGQVKSLFR
jgi:hypothetical protein